jgi:SAM-dependent methyltransferase
MSAEQDARRLSAAALAAGDATGWFEKLYAEAANGTAEVPWDRGRPAAMLVDWAGQAGLAGDGRAALVVGCGLGRDAEFVAGLGFATTAFDISETAVRVARERHPGSPVDYRVADLLDPPAEWRHAFDLVVESNNVQALPRTLRARAIAAVGTLVAPGGTLLVLSAAAVSPVKGGGGVLEWAASEHDDDGPPWPLSRAEIEAFATGGLRETSLAEVPAPDDPLFRRWRATFERVRD